MDFRRMSFNKIYIIIMVLACDHHKFVLPPSCCVINVVDLDNGVLDVSFTKPTRLDSWFCERKILESLAP